MVFRLLFFLMQILVTHMFRLIPRIQQTIPEYKMPTNYDLKCPWTLTILWSHKRLALSMQHHTIFGLNARRNAVQFFSCGFLEHRLWKSHPIIILARVLEICRNQISRTLAPRYQHLAGAGPFFFSCGFLEPRLWKSHPIIISATVLEFCRNQISRTPAPRYQHLAGASTPRSQRCTNSRKHIVWSMLCTPFKKASGRLKSLASPK